MEINPNHELMTRLNRVRRNQPGFAKDMLQQVLDSAMLQSGTLENALPMLERVNNLIIRVLREEDTENKSKPERD